jgi:hypothetical protein
MEANRDEAAVCVERAREYLAAGRIEDARRMTERAHRMFPSSDTEQLFEALDARQNPAQAAPQSLLPGWFGIAPSYRRPLLLLCFAILYLALSKYVFPVDSMDYEDFRKWRYDSSSRTGSHGFKDETGSSEKLEWNFQYGTPGDISIRYGQTQIFFPIVSSIALSLLFTFFMNYLAARPPPLHRQDR